MGERDNGYDNRVAGLDSPFQNRKNPPLRFIVLLSRWRGPLVDSRFWTFCAGVELKFTNLVVYLSNIFPSVFANKF